MLYICILVKNILSKEKASHKAGKVVRAASAMPLTAYCPTQPASLPAGAGNGTKIRY